MWFRTTNRDGEQRLTKIKAMVAKRIDGEECLGSRPKMTTAAAGDLRALTQSIYYTQTVFFSTLETLWNHCVFRPQGCWILQGREIFHFEILLDGGMHVHKSPPCAQEKICTDGYQRESAQNRKETLQPKSHSIALPHSHAACPWRHVGTICFRYINAKFYFRIE